MNNPLHQWCTRLCFSRSDTASSIFLSLKTWGLKLRIFHFFSTFKTLYRPRGFRGKNSCQRQTCSGVFKQTSRCLHGNSWKTGQCRAVKLHWAGPDGYKSWTWQRLFLHVCDEGCVRNEMQLVEIIYFFCCCRIHLGPLLLGFLQFVHLHFLSFGWKKRRRRRRRIHECWYSNHKELWRSKVAYLELRSTSPLTSHADQTCLWGSLFPVHLYHRTEWASRRC